MVALVGPSGAGKSTTAMLVPRVYDVTDGAVLVGDVDVRDALAGLAAGPHRVVTQDAHLFHETIAENLRYARPRRPTTSCGRRSTGPGRAAGPTLPDGLDTVVGERGYRFSGGEKQRIAIARLLLKAPSIVILDEATAHLDSESEAAVQRALARPCRPRPRWSSRTGSPPCATPTRSRCSTAAGSWSAAPTRAGRRRRALRRAVPDPVRGGRLAAVLCGRRGPTRARSTADR
jgi:ABC-type iron transport system FetAB ATPase subunit